MVTVQFVAELLFSLVLSWVGIVGHVGKEEMHTEFWWRKLMLRDHFEDLDVDGNIVLSWISRKYDGVKWT
jgi:hypothetical protein